MPYILQREIDKLKVHILTLGALVEERLQKAVQSVRDRDESLAKEVIEGDYEIDEMEVDLEEECLKILALHQPVANDLRFIIAVLKINNDLERIGDLAVNIGESVMALIGKPGIDIPFDFPGLSEKVKIMLKTSLDSLVNMDKSMAVAVCRMDDEVDVIHRRMYDQVREGIRKHTDHIETFTHLLTISKNLERIGDQATNIAEDVIYMIEGRIIRHRLEQNT
jgi:phosphate transport system protein